MNLHPEICTFALREVALNVAWRLSEIQTKQQQNKTEKKYVKESLKREYTIRVENQTLTVKRYSPL